MRADEEHTAGCVHSSDANEAPRDRLGLHGQRSKALLGDQASCLIGQLIAAVVLVIAIGVLDSSTVHFAYTIAVGAVATGGALLGLWLGASSHGEKALFAAPVVGQLSANGCVAAFLATWWGIGTYIITFEGPFVSTCNGYFAVWFGLVCSLTAVGDALPQLRASTSICSSTLLGLAACALIVGLELNSGPGGTLSRQMVYGMVVATLTFAVVLVMLLLQLSHTPLDASIARALHLTIVGLWGVASLWLTLTGPFTDFSNGFFALWAGTICASHLVLSIESRLYAARANERLAACWGQLLSSTIIIFATAALPSSQPLWGYALAVGIIGAVGAVAGALLLENRYGTQPLLRTPTAGGTSVSLNGAIAAFHLVWWAVGATGAL